LGLGFKRSDEKATSILDQFVKEKMLDQPIFTVVYRSCQFDQEECNYAGMITFGDIDTER
jgi:hypothetical protein